MTVTLRFFASYAESLGVPSIELDLAEGSTIDDVMKAISAMPGSGKLPPHPLVAVNHSYAKNSHVLLDGDEVALIPPVAGG
ncbi:MAG TPA: MoaD/ThiS family protein [Gemmatimonadaceae bacterium]|nr:MoaD/ThiS family protein [Gemmatimonadaceae bacterium]